MTVSVLIVRLLIAFTVLLILTRIMGRKEIAQMTFFNFISAISIGTIGASLAIDSTLSIRNGLIALVAWSIFTIVLGIISINSREARVLIEGQPRIVIKNGKIMEDELRKVRLDVDALNALLRVKNVFSIFDVDYAIFETSGKLSVMKKEPQKFVTKSDMGIQLTQPNIYPISTAVISDGSIVSLNLKKLNITSQWLTEQLKLSGINSVSEVFYAEVGKDGKLYIDKKGQELS
ncbi:DUF421 domain-containing protein [Paenisporosarcina sp. TG20]|uniref:YetF domain-containing protein n=1 Tax=Paenisporosarcina sp. TG20 TaxID=1211706 RepID=UPI0002F77780|nr:DUF421 domain-containing protein [Paenisporosarcina sp. TG20]